MNNYIEDIKQELDEFTIAELCIERNKALEFYEFLNDELDKRIDQE